MLSGVETCTSEHHNRYPRTVQGFNRHRCRVDRLVWSKDKTAVRAGGEWSRRVVVVALISPVWVATSQLINSISFHVPHVCPTFNEDRLALILESAGGFCVEEWKERICKCLIDFLCHIPFSRPYCALRWHGRKVVLYSPTRDFVQSCSHGLMAEEREIDVVDTVRGLIVQKNPSLHYLIPPSSSVREPHLNIDERLNFRGDISEKLKIVVSFIYFSNSITTAKNGTSNSSTVFEFGLFAREGGGTGEH